MGTLEPQHAPSAEMRGPYAVRAALRDHLRLVAPAHFAACRRAWGLTEEQLPLPASAPGDPKVDAWYDREPPALDRWPLVSVHSGRFSARAVDHDLEDGSTQYRTVVPMQVFGWVKAEGMEAAIAMRDNFATALRISLLSHRALGSADADMVLQEGTMIVDYSEVTPVKGDRFVAGGLIGFDVHVTETLTERLAMPERLHRDTVDGVSAVAGLLPTPPTL